MNNGKKWLEEDEKAYELRRLSMCNKIMMQTIKRGLGPRIAKENLANHKYVTRYVEKWTDGNLVYGSLCVMCIAVTGEVTCSRVYWYCGDIQLVNDTSESVVKYYEISEDEALDWLEEPSVGPLNRENK